MLLIGLTGGIASGKSVVGRMLRAQQIPVVDADQLARDAVAPGSPGLASIVAHFGRGVLCADGTLDRKRLGDIVFGDAKERAVLNGIVHPEVARLAVERLDTFRNSGAPVAVYEVPLLFENGLQAMMDKTLLVAAAKDTQIARMMTRDQLSREQAEARVAAQMSLEEKRRLADVVIENDGDLDLLAARLCDAWQRLTGEQRSFSQR